MTQEIQIIFNEVEKFYQEKDFKKDMSLSDNSKKTSKNEVIKNTSSTNKNK